MWARSKTFCKRVSWCLQSPRISSQMSACGSRNTSCNVSGEPSVMILPFCQTTVRRSPGWSSLSCCDCTCCCMCFLLIYCRDILSRPLLRTRFKHIKSLNHWLLYAGTAALGLQQTSWHHTHLWPGQIPATGFLLSISLNDKDEKSLISFQRKPNNWTVRLGAKGKVFKIQTSNAAQSRLAFGSGGLKGSL